MADIQILGSKFIDGCILYRATYNISQLAYFLNRGADSPDLVIYERLPPRLSSKLTTIRIMVEEFMREYIISSKRIAPSEWKPVSRSRGWKPNGKTQHERDSEMLIRYYVWIGFGKEL